MQGIFIVFEGPNGAGKTTVLEFVSKAFEQQPIPIVRTKEPTNSNLGNHIREHQSKYTKEVLACLVAANRYEHLEKVVGPAIQKGHLILCDRYLPSSLVYQLMDGLDISFIKALNKRIVIPDLTIFLTADDELLAKRLQERGQLTRFEKDQKKEVQLYRDAQAHLADEGWNTLSLDSGQETTQDLTSKIVKAIAEILPI